MRLATLNLRSLSYHRRASIAIVLGVVAGASALAGALIVGDSMRFSLRDVALARLGGVHHALAAPRFIREALADELDSAPAIILPGGAVNADSGARVDRIDILAVDERFWNLGDADSSVRLTSEPGRYVVLNAALAGELNLAAGDDVLLRIPKPPNASTDTLLGRRDDTALSLRLSVRAIVPAEGMAAFSLHPGHRVPRNAFVPLSLLQRVLDRPGQANRILVSSDEPRLQDRLREHLSLADLDLTLRRDDERGYIALESKRFLLEPEVERAARVAASQVGATASRILTYLANDISIESDVRAGGIPYSTVTALDDAAFTTLALRDSSGTVIPIPTAGEIVLNEWAATDLSAAIGDRVRLSYYVTGSFGELDTREAVFTLSGVVPLAGVAADPGFTPLYEGITDSKSIADWDPPFPVDLKRIRPKDDAYWERHQATPKAFIAFDRGVELWADATATLGRTTSIRITSGDAATVAEAFARALLRDLDPAKLGLAFSPVRAEALAAGGGSTDFGGLFIGFSFFLIASAGVLVILLFRLGVERRSSEIGALLAVGFARRQVSRLLLAEGAVLATVGSALGVVAAGGYAWLMLTGLRSWWSEAVNAPFLRLHLSAVSLALGFVGSIVVALLTIGFAVRDVKRSTIRDLMAGGLSSGRPQGSLGTGRAADLITILAMGGAGVMLAMVVATELVSSAIGFFAIGALTLVATLLLIRRWLRGASRYQVERPGTATLVSLGVRNARRHPRRSILIVSLIASATFVVTTIQTFRVEVDPDQTGRRSATGGFTLYAESAVPLQFDLNTAAGLEALNVVPQPTDALAGVTVYPFRLSGDDETSCLNLYVPTKPRIIGATDAMMERGGFVFDSTMNLSGSGEENPWQLLGHVFDDGAIPAIGDEAAVKWQLHSGLGKDLVIDDEGGQPVRLRFVALLKGSALQSELVVAESNFRRVFPSVGGYSFFLIETPSDTAKGVGELFERELAPFAFDAAATADRLAGFYAVQNTYLSTFQALGGVGLILGTVGLAAVMLRNLWERRGELALLRALGFSKAALRTMVLAENGVLVIGGLFAGFGSGLLAVGPFMGERSAVMPWGSIALTVSAVLAVGVGAGTLATTTMFRAPILSALRRE